VEIHSNAAASRSRKRRAGPLHVVHGDLPDGAIPARPSGPDRRAMPREEARAATGPRSTTPHGPHLDRIDDLRDAGWLFLPPSPTEIRGVRVYHPGWMDKLLFLAPDYLAAVRYDPDGTLRWRRQGGQDEMVEEILALPAPSASGRRVVLDRDR
jgi:hypothetical protein